jgi:hypothetical protein
MLPRGRWNRGIKKELFVWNLLCSVSLLYLRVSGLAENGTNYSHFKQEISLLDIYYSCTIPEIKTQ